jgi:plastocyanin
MIFLTQDPMMTFLIPLLLALLSPQPPGGTIEGRVVLMRAEAPAPDASNAVVWLDGVSAGSGPAAARGEMRSEQKKFAPRALVVRRNATVQFPNADAIYHNVFSVSGANRFDLGLYRGGAAREKKFEEPGLVRVYCNIHPQMVGFVMVVDSGFAAVTGPDGSFRFEGVPAGPLTLKVWHEETGEVRAPVTVRAGDAPVTVRLDATAFKPQAHKNKYGKDYPPGAGSDDERY